MMEAMVRLGAALGRGGRRDRAAATTTSCSAPRCPAWSDLWDVYQRLAERCDYALHLGLTEAGMGPKGMVNSTAALAPLLTRGIGDTIRVSLTPEPGASRVLEVEVAQLILQSMGLRLFAPDGHGLPGLRPHHLHAVSGAGGRGAAEPQDRRCRSGARNTPASRPCAWP